MAFKRSGVRLPLAPPRATEGDFRAAERRQDRHYRRRQHGRYDRRIVGKGPTHPVLFSSRNPANLKPLVDGLGLLAKAGTVDDALAFGDVIFMAVPIPGASANLQRLWIEIFWQDRARRWECGRGARRRGPRQGDAGEGHRQHHSFLPSGRSRRSRLQFDGPRIFAKEAHRSGEPMAIPLAGDDKQAVETASQLVRERRLRRRRGAAIARQTSSRKEARSTDSSSRLANCASVSG